MEVKKVTLQDLEQLREIGIRTFSETFSANNSPENIKNYLEISFSDSRLKKELNDPNSEFYFAIINDEIAGYLKLNFGNSQTELQNENAVEIERIYVLKKFQGVNIGQQLYNHALQIARQKKAYYIWLGVWEKNLRAIKFYTKNGFIEFDKHIFKLGDDEQTDIMMKLKLPE